MELDIIYWDHQYNLRLLANLSVVVAIFTSLRFFSGMIAHIDASEELFKKDNPAFGLSMAGTALAVTFMLIGSIYGDPEISILDGMMVIAFHGILGLGFMAITRIIFDKVALAAISLRDEIVKGNMAVSIADTGNVLAAAIIIRAAMGWVPYTDSNPIFMMCGFFALSQVMLTVATLARIQLFKARHEGFTVESELQKGNIAFALTFAGRLIGTALAIEMASELVPYEDNSFPVMLVGWVLASVIVILALKALSMLAEHVILMNVNMSHEVLNQRNIAVGAVRAAVYISLGLLLAEL